MRRRPAAVPEGWKRVSPSLLRYSDEQSIAGVSAVFAAVERMGEAPQRFEDWGVVAASRFLGRANLSMVLRRFEAEGVWGTSPHLIPHFALHSPSGTISLALGTHGPNLGVGGGLYSAAEAFLAAMTWLEMGVVPGVWVVLTGWAPEFLPSTEGAAASAGECQSLAIALTRGSGQGAASFRITVGSDRASRIGPTDLVALVNHLEAKSVDASPILVATCGLGDYRVTLEPARARRAEVCS